MANDFESRPETQMGKIGEMVVDHYLASHGWVVYWPNKGVPHEFDAVCIARNVTQKFLVEVKTKPARRYYKDTGFNVRHYQRYIAARNAFSTDVWIFFVDQDRGRFYGHRLSELERPRIVATDPGGLNPREYPFRENGIIYFPTGVMENYGPIEPSWLVRIKELSQRATSYQPTEVIL